MLEKATQYILDLITDNKELKSFPKEFINEAALWVKSWFLKPEKPKEKAQLEDPNKSIEVKRYIIEGLLEELQDNAAFQKDLAARIEALEQQRAKLKNVVSGADIEAGGNVHIGDKGNALHDSYDEKNIIKDSTIKAGGDFRLGDDVISGDKYVNIVHNHFNHPSHGDKPVAASSNLKSTLKALLAKEKTAEVIEQLLDYTETKDQDANNTVLLLSARFNRIKTQEDRAIISNSEAGIERNKINVALTNLIDGLSLV